VRQAQGACQPDVLAGGADQHPDLTGLDDPPQVHAGERGDLTG
jgi:hypothetical protein